ncbi:MAG: hypothetical protein E7141_05855 [Rikenellaceae bacterium]|nr:hypothetical protein [Rikenellaceae bacterium]
MKNLLYAVVFLLTAILCSCQTDNTTDVQHNGDGTTITITLPESRTSLGEKEGTTYPVYWSEGDRIAINGVSSQDVSINADDRSKATFFVGESVKYPYSITYPYTSTTTASSPKVVVPTVQNYTEGSFESGSTPMCGYLAEHSNRVTLKHLAGVLRFPVKASSNGIVLKSVVITSKDGVKLSGEFAVNCSAATMSATANATNTITYNLPNNFTLSTSQESVFYIAIPAVNIGDCTIEFIEASGEKMTCAWSDKSVTAGIVREFKTITYKRGINGGLEPLESEDDTLIINYPTVYGYVKDTNGNPIKGVAVSDGFSVVATDEKGYYTLDVSSDTWYIFISLPSEYEVPINEYGQPCFYKKYPSSTPQYDFTLTPLAGGKEKKFALVTFGDPQVSSSSKLKRFKNEAVPGIKAHITELSKTIPCYGITLGDIISNGASSNTGAYRDDMRDGFAKSSIGLPVFQVMGNHDNTFFNSTQPVYADERNSSFELKAQREHEDMFGPANYSFNRGDVHIIGMRDIVYTVNTSPSNYSPGILDSQWEWLKQDLALVPKDKMVVICVHIPFLNRTTYHIQDILKLLNTYKEAHVMSGHTHLIRTYEHKANSTGYDNVYEHNVGAVCGCWWAHNMCTDGAPNGFGVFIGEGNTFTDWYYSGYHTGMNTRQHQMRLYRGNAVTGAAVSGTDTNGTKGYYAFGFGEDYLMANIYFADTQWTIKVYENGVHTGNMELVPYAARPKISAMAGDGTLASPRTPKTSTSCDMYYTGLRLGIQGVAESATGNGATCYHLYKYKLKNKNATIKVEAIDGFGNKYTETKITSGTDYSMVK